MNNISNWYTHTATINNAPITEQEFMQHQANRQREAQPKRGLVSVGPDLRPRSGADQKSSVQRIEREEVCCCAVCWACRFQIQQFISSKNRKNFQDCLLAQKLLQKHGNNGKQRQKLLSGSLQRARELDKKNSLISNWIINMLPNYNWIDLVIPFLAANRKNLSVQASQKLQKLLGVPKLGKAFPNQAGVKFTS